MSRLTTPFCFRGRGYSSAAGDVGVPGFKGRQCDLQQKMRRLVGRRGCGEMIETQRGRGLDIRRGVVRGVF